MIDELGYEASLVAQSLRNHRTNVIGILVADLEPFSTELLKGAADAIRGTGFELVVYSAGGRVGDQVGWERRYLSRLSGTLVDGAVLVTPTVVDVQLRRADRRRRPAHRPVRPADRRLGQPARRAAGHRAPARPRPPPDRDAHRPARPAVRPAARGRATGRRWPPRGYRWTRRLLRVGAYDPEISAAPRRHLLTAADRPTAIFAANDISAIATVEAATGLGLRVPEDLSVVGFDNVPESALYTPPLTTVHQPIREMGQRAVELLIRLISGDDVEPDPRHARDRASSCGSPPAPSTTNTR